MSFETKLAIEFIGVFMFIAAIIGAEFFSFSLLSHVYNDIVCNTLFTVISLLLSLIYLRIVYRLNSKIL